MALGGSQTTGSHGQRIEAGGPWQSHNVLPQTCAATLKGSRSGACSPSGCGWRPETTGSHGQRRRSIETGGPWQSKGVLPQGCAATRKGSRSGACSPSSSGWMPETIGSHGQRSPRAVGCLRMGGDSEWLCVRARPLAVMDRIDAGGPWQSHSVLQQACAATLKGSKGLGFRV